MGAEPQQELMGIPGLQKSRCYTIPAPGPRTRP
jgi:hypothetical protein